MKENYELVVNGEHHTWVFNITATQSDVDDWRCDGLEVNLVENQIPAWYVFAGLPVGVWIFVEDVLKWIGRKV